MTHPLDKHWDQLTDPTKTVLSLAYRYSKNQGRSGRLRTRFVVAALRSLQPDPLNELLSKIPDNALPASIPIQKPPIIEPLNELKPDLSPCVRETLTELGSVSSPARPITPLDLFVDLARHGGGSTVSSLRNQGVTPEKIDGMLQDIDRTVRRRR